MTTYSLPCRIYPKARKSRPVATHLFCQGSTAKHKFETYPSRHPTETLWGIGRETTKAIKQGERITTQNGASIRILPDGEGKYSWSAPQRGIME